MVLLTTAAAFAALSLVLFIIGLLAGRPDMAMLGAILMIGIGGTGVVDGYQVVDGETTTVVDTTRTVALDDISLSTHVQTRDVSSDLSAPTGIEFNGTGSSLYVSSAGDASVHQYDTIDWGIGAATHVRSFDVSTNDTEPLSVAVEGGGKWMVVAGDNTDTLYQYQLSEPYNVSTASPYTELNVSATSPNPNAVEFGEAGSVMFVLDNGNAEVDQYDLSTAYDVSTAALNDSFDTSTQTSTPHGMAFGDNGTRMLLSGSSSGNVYQYELSEAYAVASAAYSGNALDTSGETNRVNGIAYVDDNWKIFGADRQADALVSYNSTTEESVTERNTRKTYDTVDTMSGFPLDIIMLLIGAVMLMAGAGEASETGRDTPPWRRNQ